MTLMTVSPVFRDGLCFLTILLFLLCAADVVLAFRYKNWIGILCSMLLFLGTYTIHTILKIVISFLSFDALEQLARSFGDVSAWICLIAILTLFVLGLAILYRIIIWRRSHILQVSVKESIDNLPSGLAFYEDDGNCLMVNHTMNRISRCLTGHDVLDGRELERVSHDILVDMDGRKYQISHRLLSYRKGHIHELVADDVTELHEKTQALSRRNAELADMTGRLKQYNANIDASVRKQEILQAKVQIHDEMNRLLLATGNAADGTVSAEDLQKILFTWKNNALLLCKEADNKPASNTEQDLQTLADIIGMKIEWDGRIETRDSHVLQLFELATREALSNAAKHAKAKHLYIQLRESESMLMATYTNDGLCPNGEVHPAGGLKDLCRMLEREKGHMSIVSAPAYMLTITIPKGGEAIAI